MMTRVFDRLFLGDRYDAELLALRNLWRISTVITLCREPLVYRNPEVLYVDFPLATREPISPAQLVSILETIETHIAAGRVLVHCETGASRSPVVVAAYLDHVGYLSFTDSLLFLRHLRGDICPHPSLVASIRQHLA